MLSPYTQIFAITKGLLQLKRNTITTSKNQLLLNYNNIPSFYIGTEKLYMKLKIL